MEEAAAAAAAERNGDDDDDDDEANILEPFTNGLLVSDNSFAFRLWPVMPLPSIDMRFLLFMIDDNDASDDDDCEDAVFTVVVVVAADAGNRPGAKSPNSPLASLLCHSVQHFLMNSLLSAPTLSL